MTTRVPRDTPHSTRSIAIDSLEWEATTEFERWVAGYAIITLGVLSLSIHTAYAFRTASSVTAILLGPAIPVALSFFTIAAVAWLLRSEYKEWLPRIALWCVGGAAVLVAVGQLTVLYRQAVGLAVLSPLFMAAYLVTTGTAVGLVIGIYDADLQRTKRDLDDQRERSERYAQQLSVLNRILRHDFRTGVQVIIGSVERLPDPVDVDPSTPLERIREQATEMYETAETARELQRLMGERENLINDVDVGNKVASAVELVETAYPGAEIHTPTRESISIAACRILDLAFKELIANAVEHNDSDPSEVEIACESTETAVVVRITDNGPGIPAREVEPLRHGEETALAHTSGIGLWLANWIIELSDGSLTFDGNEYGGTTVTVRLPR